MQLETHPSTHPDNDFDALPEFPGHNDAATLLPSFEGLKAALPNARAK
jgi:hypothetical protein